MKEKKHNIMSDDEYQFPKDEYLDQSSSSEDDQSSASAEFSETATEAAQAPSFFDRFPFLKSKKVWGVVILAVVLIVGMQMMHHGADSKKALQKQQSTLTAAEQAQNQMASQLSDVQSSQSTTASQVTQLKQQMSSLQSQVASSSSTANQLSQSVEQLTAQVKLLTQSVEQNKKALTVKKSPKKAAVSAKPVIYHVKAVVPGRAWLVASTGKELTVSNGDKINGYYGTVKLIDSDNGRVITSSGHMIKYGQDDH